jgi:hypothetical protein
MKFILEDGELEALIHETETQGGKSIVLRFGPSGAWLDTKDEAARWAIERVLEWRNPVQI